MSLVEFQSRSQTGHGYNVQVQRKRKKLLEVFQSRSQTGHGYNERTFTTRYRRSQVSIPFTNRSWLQPRTRTIIAHVTGDSFNPVHKPVMVTTLHHFGVIRRQPDVVSIPFTNRSWLQRYLGRPLIAWRFFGHFRLPIVFHLLTPLSLSYF